MNSTTMQTETRQAGSSVNANAVRAKTTTTVTQSPTTLDHRTTSLARADLHRPRRCATGFAHSRQVCSISLAVATKQEVHAAHSQPYRRAHPGCGPRSNRRSSVTSKSRMNALRNVNSTQTLVATQSHEALQRIGAQHQFQVGLVKCVIRDTGDGLTGFRCDTCSNSTPRSPADKQHTPSRAAAGRAFCASDR